MSKILSINLPPKGLHEELKRMANIYGTTMGRLAVKAIKIGLEKMEEERAEKFRRLVKGGKNAP